MSRNSFSICLLLRIIQMEAAKLIDRSQVDEI
jgi:hypothetical protein